MRKLTFWVAILVAMIATPATPVFGQAGLAGAVAKAAESQSAAEVLTLSDLQEMIDAAAARSAELALAVPVIVPDGCIIRGQPGETLIWRASTVIRTASGDLRSGRIVFTNPEPGAVLIQGVGDSYGAGFKGFDLRCNPADASDFTFIQTGRQQKNATIANLRIEHRGKDVLGLVVDGQESLTVEKVESRCSVPVVLWRGDNIAIRDGDFGTAATEEARATMHSGKYPCTCIWVRGMPNSWTFDGSQTWQGGDHAVFGEVESATSGQNLNLYNFRYEQSLSRASDDKRAIELRFTGAHLERVLIVGSRYTDREKGLYVTGALQVEWIGSWLPGTRYERR